MVDGGNEPAGQTLAGPCLAGPVAITGVSGFVGARLAHDLLAAGIAVRGLLRRPADHLPAELQRVSGDLDDDAALDALIADSSLIVHCAGAVRGRDRSDFDAVNVDGSRRLLDRIAATHPGARLLHLSSLAARHPELSHYAASKHTAEALFDPDLDCRWTLLRPTAIYGPGDKELAPLLHSMGRGWAPTPAVKGQRLTLIHIDDVITAILAAADASSSIHGCFELSDARCDGYDWTELCQAVATLRGGRVRRLPMPTVLLRTAGSLSLATARLLRRAPMLSPGKVRELTHPDWSCDPSPFTEATGWTPKVTLAAGLGSVLGQP